MEEFLRYIDQLVEEYKTQEHELLKTGCKDEANFAKIKINICDICKTLYNVSVKKVSAMRDSNMNDDEYKKALRKDYMEFLTKIPENWEVSYAKAKQHEDATKIVIEETKLEVLQIIKKKFEEICR